MYQKTLKTPHFIKHLSDMKKTFLPHIIKALKRKIPLKTLVFLLKASKRKVQMQEKENSKSFTRHTNFGKKTTTKLILVKALKRSLLKALILGRTLKKKIQMQQKTLSL